MSIQNLPSAERPRERLAALGPGALSTTELLAIIMGSGTRGKSVLELARELLTQFRTIEAISESSLEELCQIHGLGKVKAIQLQAAFALARRLFDQSETRPRILTPKQAYHLLSPDLAHLKEERVMVVLQDVKRRVTHKELVAIGTLTEVVAHPREVFYPAVRHKAASLLIAHNHPSGDPTPSRADIKLTHALIAAGKALDIPLSDHLIIGHKSFTSLREHLDCWD